MSTIIYARKSSESEDRQVRSLADQVRELKAIASREGIRIAEVIEESKSAKDPGQRPEFNRLVESIYGGGVDSILTWSINRLARNPLDWGHVAHLLQTGRIRFIKTPERTYLPEDNALLLSIENGMATAFIQDLLRNTVRGMKSRVERGWHSGKPPVGFRNDAESRTVVVDPDRFRLVRLAWERALTGDAPLSSIYKEALAWGLGVKIRGKISRPISRSCFYKIFSNRFYLGEVQYKGAWSKGGHEPMVSLQEFERVQRIHSDRHKPKKSLRKLPAFGGLFRCAKCGCAIVGETKVKLYKGTNRRVCYTYYHCTGHRGCRKQGVRQEAIEQHLLDKLKGLRICAPAARWLKDAIEQALVLGAKGSALAWKSRSEQVSKLEQRLRSLALMKADGDLRAADYSALHSETLDELERLQRGERQCLHEAREKLRYFSTGIDAVALASTPESQEAPPTERTAATFRTAGVQVLNLATLDFSLDPLITKLTTFEPLIVGSEKDKTNHSELGSPIWYALIDDLLTIDPGQEGANCCRDRREDQFPAQPTQMGSEADPASWEHSS